MASGQAGTTLRTYILLLFHIVLLKLIQNGLKPVKLADKVDFSKIFFEAGFFV